MNSRSYGIWLWVLLGLFAIRVAAQLVQWRLDVPGLPVFEAWHSATVPYGVLLAAQAAILVFYTRVALAFTRGRVEPSARSARGWLSIGAVYAAVMLGRLVLGLTVLSNHYWFAAHLPTLFHIVLASFMLVAGSFHLRALARMGREVAT